MNFSSVKLLKGVDSWDNFSIRVSTPEGNATIIIVESQPGQIKEIFYFVGKQGSALNAWAVALCEQTLTTIKTKGLWAALESIKDITSDRLPRDTKGLHAFSGPQALYIALKAYQQTIPGMQKSNDNYRPGRIG